MGTYPLVAGLRDMETPQIPLQNPSPIVPIMGSGYAMPGYPILGSLLLPLVVVASSLLVVYSYTATLPIPIEVSVIPGGLVVAVSSYI